MVLPQQNYFWVKEKLLQTGWDSWGKGYLLGREVAHQPIRWWAEMEEGRSFRKPSLKSGSPQSCHISAPVLAKCVLCPPTQPMGLWGQRHLPCQTGGPVCVSPRH